MLTIKGAVPTNKANPKTAIQALIGEFDDSLAKILSAM